MLEIENLQVRFPIKKGGVFQKKNVEEISFSFDEKPIVKTNLNFYKFDKLVIACGAFSKKLTDQANEKIPLLIIF